MNNILMNVSDYVSFFGYIMSLIFTIKIAHSSKMTAFKYMALGIGIFAFISGIWLTSRLLINHFPDIIPYWAKVSEAIAAVTLLMHLAGVIFLTISLYRLSREYKCKIQMVEQGSAPNPLPAE